MDFDLLHILGKKDNYVRFKPFLKENILSREAATIASVLGEYFSNNPSVISVDWVSFETYFLGIRGGRLRDEEILSYKVLLGKLATYSGSGTADELLTHYIELDTAARVADLAIRFAEGESGVSISSIGELVRDCEREVGRSVSKSDLFAPVDISSIVSSVSSTGYEWRLEEMNISLGPLRKGDFVLVAASVETGKTTFVADQVSYMATQISDDRPVIWINNEESSGKVIFRIIQAALARDAKNIIANQTETMNDYTKLMGGNRERILVLNPDSGIISVDQMTALFKDMNPAIIVFDQLDKVHGFSKEERDDIRLGKLYQWARGLAHEYGPVLAISQADGSAHGEPWIRENQLRGSKVDKPGELDAIITIGRTTEKGKESQRYIHIPKNKLFGGLRSQESERHGYWEVTIKPEIARYEGTR